MSDCNHDKCLMDLCVKCCYCGSTLTSEQASDPYAKLLLGVADMVASQKIEEDGKVIVKEAAGGFNLACDFIADRIRKLVAKGVDRPQSDHLTFQDYKDVLDGHKKLVREIDVILSGEENAATQASLIDLMPQIRDIMTELHSLRADNQQLKEAIRR